jgi:hypothetical protein
MLLTCPLTMETFGLVGAEELAALGPDGILVNLARGTVAEELALIDALRQRAIRGIVLDVVASEPLAADSPLWDLGNVLLNPHSAATLATENAALVGLFIRNLDLFQAGEPLIKPLRPNMRLLSWNCGPAGERPWHVRDRFGEGLLQSEHSRSECRTCSREGPPNRIDPACWRRDDR